jgi:hypothetical protein
LTDHFYGRKPLPSLLISAQFTDWHERHITRVIEFLGASFAILIDRQYDYLSAERRIRSQNVIIRLHSHSHPHSQLIWVMCLSHATTQYLCLAGMVLVSSLSDMQHEQFEQL